MSGDLARVDTKAGQGRCQNRTFVRQVAAGGTALVVRCPPRSLARLRKNHLKNPSIKQTNLGSSAGFVLERATAFVPAPIPAHSRQQPARSQPRILLMSSPSDARARNLILVANTCSTARWRQRLLKSSRFGAAGSVRCCRDFSATRLKMLLSANVSCRRGFRKRRRTLPAHPRYRHFDKEC